MEPAFPYQIEGAQWLVDQRFRLLGDGMGLGKSRQAVMACDRLDAASVLVVCPAVARVNWAREFQKWARYPKDFPFTVCFGKDDWPAGPFVIVSYDYATMYLERLQRPWHVLVLDEAHFIKSVDAKRTKAVWGKEGLVRHAKRVWALSGTPAPNHAGELWPLLYTFGATPLKYADYIERYCEYRHTPHGIHITGTKKSYIPELQMVLKPIFLRRKKEDVLTELPPIFYQDVVVEAGDISSLIDSGEATSFFDYTFPQDRRPELAALLDQQRALITTTMDTLGFGADGMKAMEAMAQSISTLRRYVGLQKLDAVSDMITAELEANAYEKVVIFAIHRDVIEILRTRLRKFKAVTLYGGTEPATRQKNIDKFQNNPKCRVFIGNIQAAGTAITLTAAHNVVFIEQSWVPGDNAQAAMRCHRIGQTKPVTVRFVGLADSIDQRIANILKRKAHELTKLFDEPGLTESQSNDEVSPQQNSVSLEEMFK